MSTTIASVSPIAAAVVGINGSSSGQDSGLDHQLDRLQQALDGVVRGSGKSSIPANETRAQQQTREAAEHKVTRADQVAREAKVGEKTLQEQKEREAREHGLASPAASTAAAVQSAPASPPVAQTDSAITNGVSAASGGVQARRLSAYKTFGISSATAAVNGTGIAVGEGTHPLHMVPKNGGELSEAPTTVADINAVIKKIDPTLLTDPSQKGEGKLKGLPYGKMFEAAGAATGIDPALLYADSQVETGDNKNGRVLVPNNINSIQTAPGVWPTTENAATNLFTGAYVMKDYIDKADGNLKRGLNAYNTGNLDPSEKGFADGYSGYYEGVMAAHGNVEKAIKDPSIIEAGQGGNVSIASQI